MSGIEKRVAELVKPANQDRKLFNEFKKALLLLSKIDDKQLAMLSFEIWHEARTRGAVVGEQ